MSFISPVFFVFLSTVLVLHWSVPQRYRHIVLLVASYFFYAYWDVRFLSLILVSTTVDFAAGARIDASSSSAVRRWWLGLSVVVNLGMLGFFKYAGFFAHSFVVTANSLGFHVSPVTVEVILPIGISFYTFQTMSYTLDIYRRHLNPTRSFLRFAVFVAFFPQLMAGPIVRATEFLWQLDEKRRFDWRDLEVGMRRFLHGFVKKAFVADTLAIYLVDPVFAAPGNYSAAALFIAMLGFMVQVYADFSGYSSMAVGVARMLGLRIPENFRYPFLATSFPDFWRRWHITLFRFLRDYVYIPLGGSRHGNARMWAAVGISTLLSGLWHGAGWTFVAWGGLLGVFVILDHEVPWHRATAIRWLKTQGLIALSCILFRSPDFETAADFLVGMLTSSGSKTITLPAVVFLAIAVTIADHVYGWLTERRASDLKVVPPTVYAVVYASVVVLLLHVVPTTPSPFMYFQF
jgi:alginate O-acetyltransferase complex protein AlgI